MSDNRTSEEKIQKIKNLLSQKNGQIDQELKDEIFKITTKNTADKAKNLLKDLDKAKDFDSNDVVQELTKIEPPEIVKESIKKTISSILEPIKTTFVVDLAKYVDAISVEEEATKEIPRTINKNSIKKIENGRFVSLSGNEKIINPEFKQLLSTGYIPRKETNQLLDGTIESEYLLNVNGGDQPSSLKETIKTSIYNPAALFKKAFKNVDDMTSTSVGQIEIFANMENSQNLNSLRANSNLQNSTTNNQWNISYKEIGNKYYFNVKNNIESFYNNKTIINTSSYALVGDLESSMTNAEKISLRNINILECERYKSDELFSQIIYQGIKNSFTSNVDSNNSQKSAVLSSLSLDYNSFLTDLVDTLMSIYNENRLLKKFKLPNTIGLSNEDLEKNNLIILNLLNFIPEPSEDLKLCNKQPHPLNLDLITDLMTKKFNEVGLQMSPSVEYCSTETNEKPKNAITESTNLGILLMMVRTIVFENILKSLFIFDSNKYEYYNNLNKDLLNDFFYLKTIEELKKYNVLEDFENIIENNYEFLKQNSFILQEDEVNNSRIKSLYLNNEKINDENLQLKILIRSITKKTINYIKKLVGVSSNSSVNNLFYNQVVINEPFDIASIDYSTFGADGYLQIRSSEQLSRYSRFNELREKKYFFVYEKYIKIDNLFKTTGWSSSNVRNRIVQKYSYIKNFITFKEYVDFLNRFAEEDLSSIEVYDENGQKITNSRTAREQLFSFILNKPKIGTRMVLVSQRQVIDFFPTYGGTAVNETTPLEQINESTRIQFENFLSNNTLRNLPSTLSIKFDIQKIKNEKLYSFIDLDFNKSKFFIYNSFPITKYEEEVDFSYFTSQGRIQEFYNTSKQRVLSFFQTQDAFHKIILKSLMFDKIPNLAIFHSNSALSNPSMDNLFNATKTRMLDLYESSINIKNYNHKNSTEKNGGSSAKYKQDLENVGNPTGGTNFDLLQFLITTPILILKGITQLMDPNIAIASQIVNAAGSGLLFPKFENGQPVYPGEKVILPTALASLALLPINIFGVPPVGFGIGPPVTPLPGMLYWALEPLLWKLPYFQNQAAKSDAAKNLKNDPKLDGLKIGDPSNFQCDVDQDE